MTEAKKDRERQTRRRGSLAKRNEHARCRPRRRAASRSPSVERQIQQELAAERAKIPAVVASLTDEVYKLALA